MRQEFRVNSKSAGRIDIHPSPQSGDVPGLLSPGLSLPGRPDPAGERSGRTGHSGSVVLSRGAPHRYDCPPLHRRALSLQHGECMPGGGRQGMGCHENALPGVSRGASAFLVGPKKSSKRRAFLAVGTVGHHPAKWWLIVEQFNVPGGLNVLAEGFRLG